MRVFLITALVALTVASPDIGLLRQQQQGSTGYEYQPQQLNHQLYQQQQTFTVNHNENPSQFTQSKSEVFFIKYETQQEAGENYAWAPTRVNPNELPREEQYFSGNNIHNNYLPPFQQQQGYYYQPQHHQQLNSQYNNQQQQIFNSNTQDIKDKNIPVEVVAPETHSVARPPYIIQSNAKRVGQVPAYVPNNTYLPSIQVNQNNFQGVGNNEAFKPCFSSNNEYLPWFYHQRGVGWRNNEYLPPYQSPNIKTAY